MADTILKNNYVKTITNDAVQKKGAIDINSNEKTDLKDVAEKFEAIFVYQMLKQARQSKLAEGMFNSEAQDTFNNMLDQEYSQILSKKNNFGIAEGLIKQFSSHVKIEEKN
ncbi:rod-binding protein [Alphaproteobacteria bacterium]|jgi:flagellar protein FlgJ|nr:rod-binding protein [Alphaproteobacteria bacterium]MDB3914707.1 rod-binding protein [Alphaproteobacteria bacterium]